MKKLTIQCGPYNKPYIEQEFSGEFAFYAESMKFAFGLGGDSTEPRQIMLTKDEIVMVYDETGKRIYLAAFNHAATDSIYTREAERK